MPKQLKRVKGLPSDLLQICFDNNIFTVKDIISKTDVDLLYCLDINSDDIKQLKDIVCSDICPSFNTTLELYNNGIPRLPTSLNDLDIYLKGGISSSSITELVGPPGIGKTQFCHMLSVCCASSDNINGGVVYIDTESSFSAERIIEIAQQKYPDKMKDENELIKCAESITVYSVSNSEELLQILQSLEEVIIEKNIKLIIIDSIAAIARREYDVSTLRYRQAALGKQAALLKLLAGNFRIPILVTNQVTTTRGGPTGFNFNSPSSKIGESRIAALGTAWAHCVNTRLILQYFQETNMITIAKSPISAVCSFPYVITEKGIERTEEPPIKNNANYWDHSIETKAL